MRRLIVSVIVLVGLLVAVDRIGLVLAERDVAHRIQADQHLSATPDVTIHGFPFLTQLFGGTYDNVDVTVRNLPTGLITVTRLTAHLHGAHVSFADVVTQHVSRIRIDRARAKVVVDFGDLAGLERQVGAQHFGALSAKTIASARVTGPHTVTLQLPFGFQFPLTLNGLPFGVSFVSVQVTQTGLVITGSATGLVVHT